MDAQELIESGLLHVYVLGAATAEESREVERMAAQFEEVRAELDRLQLETEAYAGMHGVSPRPELREQIISHVLGHEAAPAQSSNVIPLHAAQAPARIWKAVAALAGVLLAGSITLNIIHHNNLQQAGRRIADLENQNATVAQQAVNNKQRVDSLQNMYTAYHNQHQATITELSTLYRPSVISLRSKDNSQQAVLFWCSRSKTVCVDPGTLANTPSDKQYQLWAIVNGKPVDAGVFNASLNNQLQLLKIIPEADAFAITLEKQGGATAPEGPMVAITNL
ncbi:MAG: anti-sigma factor [Bacteroidetes bacterium]|nr:anti-sigma factor [Bacteroidota bacterium]